VLTPGEEVELFADYTRQWRSLVFTELNFSQAKKDVILCFGWVLVHSHAHGRLLQKGHGEVTDNLAPVRCEAVNETIQLLFLKAAQSGSVNETNRLLWAKANVDTVDHLGETALFEATSARSLNMMLLLLLARADPAHQSMSGTTPLAMAEDPGHRALLAGFARGGCSLDEKQRGFLDAALEGPVSTPLVEATRRRFFGGGKVEEDAADGEVPAEGSEAAAQLVVHREEMKRQLNDAKKYAQRIEEQQLLALLQDASEGELFRVVFAGDKMVVREEPMHRSRIIDTLSAGDEVRLLEGERGNWRKVKRSMLRPGWVLLDSQQFEKSLEKVRGSA